MKGCCNDPVGPYWGRMEICELSCTLLQWYLVSAECAHNRLAFLCGLCFFFVEKLNTGQGNSDVSLYAHIQLSVLTCPSACRLTVFGLFLTVMNGLRS